jgi:hypothetical protein
VFPSNNTLLFNMPSNHAAIGQYSKQGGQRYGARFPTEIYTRGCHWIPRMFA